MHFCGSAIFGAVSVLKDRHTVVLEVNSAILFLCQDAMGCEYYLVSCALQTLTWNSCLAILPEIDRVNSQSQAVDLWKDETSDGKQKEIPRLRYNLSRKTRMFFRVPTFLLELPGGSCQEKQDHRNSRRKCGHLFPCASLHKRPICTHSSSHKKGWSFEPMINAGSFSLITTKRQCRCLIT